VNVPIISRRREVTRKAIEDEAMNKVLKATAEAFDWSGASKSFIGGNAGLGNTGMGSAATMLSAAANRGTPAQPGTSWSNQGGMQNALIARVTQNLSSGFARAPEELELAMAEQGLSWGPPFPPGRPLDPFWGYRRAPRTFDYSVGENVQLTPRQKRISFGTLQSIWEAYDVAQICTRHLINDVRSLDYAWEPLPGIRDDVSDDIVEAEAFWDSPDKRQPFRAWLAEYLQDVIKYDAGTLYIRRTNAGDPLALEVVSGKTIIPLIDFYGRRPEDEDDEETPEDLFDGEIVPAFLQIIEGLPWDWLAADDLIYQPWNPEPDSQYGRAPLEAVLLSANTDIRFQWHFLQFFTEGSIPEGFMEAPPDQSDPAQIQHWEDTWNAIMVGDQQMKRRIRWVPSGSKFTESKPSAGKFDDTFPLYLMRRTCAAHGITPNDLGFTENVNKSSGDTQVDVQFRVGTAPLLRHCEDVINLFTKQYLKLRCRLKFDDGRETEDRVATATAEGIYIDHGVISPDEPRQRLGYPIDNSRPTGRLINNARVGPIPLLALESISGKVSPETYGPDDSQELVSTPYAAPAGVIPPQGTPEQIASAETTAQQARDLIETTTGEKPPTTPVPPNPADPAPVTSEGAPAKPENGSAGAPEDGEAEKGVDNTGGPGVTRSFSNPTTITGGTDGITVPIDDDEEDDEEEDEIKKAAASLALRRWRKNAHTRLRQGKAPRKFVDPNLPSDVHDAVWSHLGKARTREEVDAAFKAASKKASAGSRPAFHVNAQAIVDHYAPLLHAAIEKLFSSGAIDVAIKAADAKVSKSAGPPPNLRPSENSLQRCVNCCLFAHPVCVKYGDWPVGPDQTCDGWELAIDDQPVAKDIDPAIAAARAASAKALAGKAANSAELKKILYRLYGDSFLQGTHEAAQAAGGSIVSSLQGVSGMPEDYWSKWTPGYGEAAAKAADGGMREMLDAADITIKGMTDTTIDEIGNTIADGLAKGDSYEATGKAVREMIGEVNRSETIANTEYARASTEASMETYKELGVEKKEFMAEADACPECEENQDAGAIAIDDEFPNGDVPVHPNCRCAIAPVSEIGGGE
jgi:SPP1 gp7 family putative phage head morphogenesis protein